MKSAVLKERNQSSGRELIYFNAVVLLLIVASAFATIFSTHACRALYLQLQELEAANWYFQDDYGRLVLEQSVWASHHLVEKVARTELSMDAPNLADYKVITQ